MAKAAKVHGTSGGAGAKSAARLAASLTPWFALAVLLALWPRGHRRAAPGLSVQAKADPATFEAAEPGRGRMAEAPTRIPPSGWPDILWRTVREVQEDRVPRVAASVTFYTLLALFPALGVFVSLYGLVADVETAREQLIDMSAVLPATAVQILGDQMLRLAERPPATLSFAFLISLLLSVWTANAGMKALFDGLNIAYEEREKRNFFHLTLLTYGFTFGALVFLAVVAALLVAAPLALAYVGIGEEAPAWLALRWLILLGVGVAVFSVVYRYGPCRRRARWRWVTFGAVFAAAFWLLGSLGFSLYVNGFARYDATYGSLGAVIGFMMWIWVSVLIVLVGAKLNAEIEHQTARDSTEGLEKPMGRRGAVVADTVGLSAPKRLHAILGRIGAAVRRRQPNSSSSAASRAA